MRQLTGRVAVVTGAASGIGRAMAGRFAAEGMRCVLADIEQEPLDRAVTEFGAVHVLANNAGVGSGSDFAKIPLEVWEWVLNVTLWGAIHGCRSFLPILLEQDEAHIVNTSSMAALNGHPLGLAPYTVAKFGVLGLTQNLFFELAATTGGRVGVSVLIPGLTRTRIFEGDRNRPASVPAPPPSGFVQTSRAAIAEAFQTALDPAAVAIDAIRERRFYILTHPDESFDMAEQQLRWMKTNVPLVPGPGVARTADP
jgi:NAD(P)-dependent dehydrogenase (short-subunit alcohol dehydrogenase family)